MRGCEVDLVAEARSLMTAFLAGDGAHSLILAFLSQFFDFWVYGEFYEISDKMVTPFISC